MGLPKQTKRPDSLAASGQGLAQGRRSGLSSLLRSRGRVHDEDDDDGDEPDGRREDNDNDDGDDDDDASAVGR